MLRTAFAFLVFASSVSASSASSALRPSALRCEYRTNPIGVEAAQPRLTWILTSKQRAQKQTAYQVLIASTSRLVSQNNADLWDSGKVPTDQSAHIVYAGKPLRTGQQAYWKVRVWDKSGGVSSYSRIARWEMGLLETTDWRAQWIGQRGTGNAFAGAHNGFHSQFASVADTEKWVQIDLGKPQRFEAIRLFPTRPFDFHADLPGTFYPVRFRVETSDSEDFAAPKLILDRTVSDIANPGTDAPQYACTPTEARYVRLTATRLRVREDRYALALAEMQVLSGNANIAMHAPVTASDSIETNDWLTKNLTDGDLTSHAALATETPYFRKEFVTSRSIARARIYATAQGLYICYLNGKRIGNDVFTPGDTDYHKRIQYQTYDITGRLKKGNNAIGVVLGDGWYCGHVGLAGRRQYGDHPHALIQVKLDYTDGTSETVVSDETWKSSAGPIRTNDLLDGEEYDARREMGGWSKPGFAATDWQPVEATPLTSVALVAQYAPTVQHVLTLKPKTIAEKPAGAYIFDLGQNMVGWARLKVNGAAGQKVRLRFAEMLNPDGSLYTTNLRGARATDYYTLKGGGVETYEPSFTFHGFRYVELTGFPGVPDKSAITGIVVSSAVPQTGTITCSNPLVNQLQSNIQWGQRGNYLEIPTDCPQRDERLGWMGDAQIFIRTACFNSDVATFMTKWTQDVVDAQSPEGGFSDVTPRVGDMSDGAPAWGDAGVIVPWTIYQCYGDTRLIAERYPAMAKWIEYIRSENPDMLWRKRSNNNFGDWLNVDADCPRDVLATAYFAYSTRLMSKMAAALGKTEDAERYEALFQQIKTAFNGAFVAPDGRITGDTQTCYVLALRFDLLPESLRADAAKRLVTDIIDKRKGHLSTGFLGVGYLNPTLTQAGSLDVAYRLLQNDTYPSWGYSIRQGATTIWERWDGWTKEKGFQDPGMNSFNHYSLGSVGEWLYHTVAGIDLDPDHPGYSHILLHPRPGGGLTYAAATYDSLHGKIVSDWKIADGILRWHVVIPANTTATVSVPTADTASVEEGGRSAASAFGVHFLRSEPGFAIYEVGSGDYTFTFKAL